MQHPNLLLYQDLYRFTPFLLLPSEPRDYVFPINVLASVLSLLSSTASLPLHVFIRMWGSALNCAYNKKKKSEWIVLSLPPPLDGNKCSNKNYQNSFIPFVFSTLTNALLSSLPPAPHPDFIGISSGPGAELSLCYYSQSASESVEGDFFLYLPNWFPSPATRPEAELIRTLVVLICRTLDIECDILLLWPEATPWKSLLLLLGGHWYNAFLSAPSSILSAGRLLTTLSEYPERDWNNKMSCWCP